MYIYYIIWVSFYDDDKQRPKKKKNVKYPNKRHSVQWILDIFVIHARSQTKKFTESLNETLKENITLIEADVHNISFQ